MKDIKKGDVLTVQMEEVRNQYTDFDGFEAVEIETGEAPDGFDSIEALSKMHIYKVVKNDIHPDLAKYGVNIGHYTLLAEKVVSFVFQTEGEVRINGEHDIPYKTIKRTKLADTYFFEEASASTIARTLNEVEREKVKKLKAATAKAEVFMDQIVEGKRI